MRLTERFTAELTRAPTDGWQRYAVDAHNNTVAEAAEWVDNVESELGVMLLCMQQDIEARCPDALARLTRYAAQLRQIVDGR